MKIQDLKILLLKGLVVTLPLGGWSPFPLPYTSLTFLIIYAYLGLSFLTIRESLSLPLFKRYVLPLLVIWIIMLNTTLVFYFNEDAKAANSILRQFLFFSTFFAFGLKDVSKMATRGENLYGYFLVAVVGIIIAFWGGFSREVGNTGRQSLIGINPNLVAMYCASGFLVLLDGLLNTRGAISKKLVRQTAVFGLVGFALILAITGSRGAILILAASLLVYFSTWSQISPKKLSLLVPVAFLAFLSVWMMASSDLMIERMADLDKDIRITTLWPAGLEIVRQYPVFGAGLGHVEEVIWDYTRMDIALHNEYLKIATSTGLVGLFLFALVLKRLFVNALRWRRVTGSGLQLAIWTLVTLFLAKGGGALSLPFVWVIFLMLSAPPIRQELTR